MNRVRTLGTYLDWAVALYGANCKAAEFLRKLIKKVPNGMDEEVLVDDKQMCFMLLWVNFR